MVCRVDVRQPPDTPHSVRRWPGSAAGASVELKGSSDAHLRPGRSGSRAAGQ
jgi:hypothetical protein